jgi:hypothetical protein
MEVIMFTPKTSARVDLFLKIGGQVVAAIEAVPEVREMSAPLRPVLDRLQAAKDGRDKARAEVTAKLKLRDQAEVAVVKAVRQAWLDLLSVVGGDKDRAPFQVAFPAGITPILGPLPTRKTQQVVGLEERLKSLEGQAPRADAIGKARQAFEATLQAVTAAEGAMTNARAELVAAKSAFARELRILFGRVTAQFGDVQKVATFFPVLHKKVRTATTTAPIPSPSVVPMPAGAQ